MKTIIPEISWHNRDPVLSVDIQPITTNSKDFLRLASGGTDSHVLIWYMKHNAETGTVDLELACDLAHHQRAVNVVRWSPNGQFLASGDDESYIIIWKRRQDKETINILDETNNQDKETWLIHSTLRGHMKDVYDLSWSGDSIHLVSGSVDNTAIMWNVMNTKSYQILRDHKGFVQGVAWDPKNKYIATLSTDRYFRVFDVNTKKIVNRCNKSVLNVPETHQLHGKNVRLFHDDTLQSFFRRLAFSPDGELIVTPSGFAETEEPSSYINATYIYTRYDLKKPAVVLPSPDSYTVVVKFCPLKFKLKPHSESNQPLIPLAYRMVYAVATKSCVYLYDTQQKCPIGMVTNIHYTRLTDLAWSSDGRILIVSSTDGFCTLISFEANEIGEIIKNEETSAVINKENTLIKQDKQKENSLTPKPIAFRRKPKDTTESQKPTPNAAVKTVDIPLKVKTDVPIIEVQIPKDKIIRSDEKFETPEKKNALPTPIAVRKTPRPFVLPDADPVAVKTPPSKTPKQATPIAIRRQPRKILEVTPSENVNSVQAEDMAMDAWPLDSAQNEVPEKNDDAHTLTCTEDLEETGDFKLYYEDSQEEIQNDKVDVVEVPAVESVAAPKTPRRVEFKTISTPKSAKK